MIRDLKEQGEPSSTVATAVWPDPLWSLVGPPYPEDRCIHEIIEHQAACTPDAPAVSFEDVDLSYRELNARANQLAHHLRHHGVGLEVPVALFMERSIALAVAVL